MSGWRQPETASLRMSDGVRLDADIHRPDKAGPHPVLLLRQAYGRKVASTLCYAHPGWYAAQGYIVVVQDVRGRGTSGGRFEPFVDEARDGAETIAWAARLEGSSGAVGTYGFSYQGTNQLLAAGLAGPALRAMAPAMIGWDLREDWAYEGGGFNLAGNLSWALQLEAETARRAGDAEGYAAIRLAAINPAVNGEFAAWPAIARERLGEGFYRRWFDYDDEEYWRAISPSARLDRLAARDIPSFYIGGWFDTHLPGTIAAYRANPGGSRLLIGPWSHFPWDRRIQGVDFGPEAVGDVDRAQLRWFDHWLKGREYKSGEAAVQLFDMGADRWRAFDSWPGSRTAALALTSSGRASNDIESGRLVDSEPAPGLDLVVHDPWRPALSVGGAYGTPNGPAERSGADARPDVLTYTSAPLEEPLTIAGDVRAELWVEADAASFDLACVLGRVFPDNRCLTVTTGFLSPAGEGLAVVALRATCATFRRGERLRLSIALAAFPAHPVNPGTGQRPAAASLADARVVTLALASGGDRPSRLVFTLAEATP